MRLESVMSTETDLKVGVEDYYADEMEIEEDSFDAYRSVSKAALGSLFLMLLGLTSLIFPPLLMLPALGVVLGIIATRNLRRYPEELTGRIPAVLGVVGSCLLLVGGSIMHAYVYMTEVPEGYTRISFDELQPQSSGAQPDEAGLPLELDGQRIFVKGYVHPGVSDLGRIKNFILVPDMGTCCFGGQPKLTDMIEVTILGRAGIQYSRRKQRLAGTFHVTNRLKKVAGGLTGGYYSLEADYVK
jgi:hypothetical protein